MRPNREEQIATLTRLNLDDMTASFGWDHWSPGRKIANFLFRAPARRFASMLADFDQGVADSGLQSGSRQFLPVFSKELCIHGQENIPASGPLLILSNHPGLADTLALFTSLPRSDLRVAGADRPFLRALPAVSAAMLYIPEAGAGRFEVIRDIAQVLHSGGAVLTFPAGHIEPDPAVLPGAVASLDSWSESIAIFVRKVPELVIVGAVVSQVLAPQATYHPITRLRRKQSDRERLGASLQLIANTQFPGLWPITIQVQFTPPLRASSLIPLHTPQAITCAVTDFIRPTIEAASKSVL
jgi:hypothetical protein